MLSEDEVYLDADMKSKNHELTSEYIDQCIRAGEILQSCKYTKEYIEGYEYGRAVDSLIHMDGYVIAYHCWNDWKRNEEGNEVGADGIILIYEEETEEIEYLAFVHLTKNYVFGSASLFHLVDDEK